MRFFDSHSGNPTFIDLFAGAGGLSEGFVQAGFNPVAHVEMNLFAAMTLETRIAYYYLRQMMNMDHYHDYLRKSITRDQFLSKVPANLRNSVINETMSFDSLPRIFDRIDGMMAEDGITHIDAVIGGPPCQAYSLVGRAQSSHMKIPMEKDPRNDLYKLYVEVIKHYNPKLFVFENVMGILTAHGGMVWQDLKDRLTSIGYEIGYKIHNAHDFGVLQNRKRMIIIGWKKGSGMHYPEFRKEEINAVVGDILLDLPSLHPGEAAGPEYSSAPSEYERLAGIRGDDDVLTLHEARHNTQRDIEIYRIAIDKWNRCHERLDYNDLPNELKTHRNRSSFKDRFKVVAGDLPACQTMLAHISKDGHYFIHPDISQHRSITVREAARIQSFPDDYFFEGPRTAQFVQIGNAVPPLMAKKIAEAIRKELDGKS